MLKTVACFVVSPVAKQPLKPLLPSAMSIERAPKPKVGRMIVGEPKVGLASWTVAVFAAAL